MTSGADLFVVCKQCGSEVSPYVTECPYCGTRLRRRAPKLPRVHAPSRPAPGRRSIGSLLGSSGRTRTRPRAGSRGGGRGAGRLATGRPYATIALVSVCAVAWIVFHAEPSLYGHMALFGPIHGEWWKLFTSPLAAISGPYLFVALLTLAIFGWLLESRHGPLLVLALFFGAGAVGALVAVAVYPLPLVAGANAGTLAIVAAWAGPDLLAARADSYYEGDLLGAAALSALLLAMPFALQDELVIVGNSVAAVGSEASWLAGVVGAAIGLLVGLGIAGTGEQRD
jgi:membrane associated rhomboid family serine protease